MTIRRIESGTRNKAEALFLLKGHEPRHRKYSDAGSSADWERENYPPAVVEEPGQDMEWTRKWAESMQRVAARHPENETQMDIEARFGPEGSKISDEEGENFLGPLPTIENLPAWLREALSADHEKKWQEVEKVKVPYEIKKHPWFYGAIYGLLRYHSMTRDTDGHPQTWVSVSRLAKEAGCTPRYVDYILRALERLGIINTEFRPGQSNLFTLFLPDPGRISWMYYLREKNSGLFVDY
jgi:hypothetical protein